MRGVRTLSVLLAVIALALPAQAFIPQADRVARAIAKQNKASGRTQALRLEVVMRDSGGEAIGRGSLVSHPSGLARLELRGAGGLVERHVLQGSEHLAARGGTRVPAPRAFLPPLFLLQSESRLALTTGLGELGGATASIGLSECGESDCYVIGDPARVPPAWEPPAPVEVDEETAEVVAKLLDGETFAGRPAAIEDGDGLVPEGPVREPVGRPADVRAEADRPARRRGRLARPAGGLRPRAGPLLVPDRRARPRARELRGGRGGSGGGPSGRLLEILALRSGGYRWAGGRSRYGRPPGCASDALWGKSLKF